MTKKNTRQALKDYATEYKIGKYKLAWRGKGWAIIQNLHCYNKSLKALVYEPLPSSRDEEFFAQCRFGLEEAKEIIEKLNKGD